jgi:hypothetical protein
MSARNLTCPCAGSLAAWQRSPGDRFCGLCGRRFVAVLPLQPLLDAGPPATVAAYLRPHDGGGLRGRAHFLIVGAGGAAPEVAWAPGEVPLEAQWAFSPPASLRVRFRTDHPAASGSEPVAAGRLTVTVRGEAFPFAVRAFALGRHGERPWLSWGAGEPPPARKRVLAVFRGAGRVRTFLNARLGGAPAQWERIACDHPAVTVRPVRADAPSPVAVAAVEWDPSGLPPEDGDEQVPFDLHFVGLDHYPNPFRQKVRWRLELPLRCDPAGIRVPLLTGGAFALHRVRLTNADRQDLVVKEVSSDVPWVRVGDVLPRMPLPLRPGEGGTVWLSLEPEALPDGYGPHLGRVTFLFKGLGAQHFPVCVEEVRHVRPLAGPLLIDPGPPSVALGQLDADGAVHLCGTAWGEAGPERFGLAPTAYARAAFGAEGAAELLARLIPAARDLARREAQLDAERVLVCGHPWVPSEEVLGVPRADWLALACAQASVLGGVPSLLLRIDAWATHAAWLDADRPPRVHRTPRLAVTLGPGILRALLAGLGERAEAADLWTTQLQGELSEAAAAKPSRLGLLAAAEGLLCDYRWGPDYAWRRLLVAAREWLPELPHRDFSAADADAALRQGARRYLGQLLAKVPQRGDRCLLLSPLFAGPDFGAEVQSASQSLGIVAECRAAAWLTLLGRLPAPPK